MVGSLMPLGNHSSELIPNQDKWMHIMMYAVQSYLVYGIMCKRYQDVRIVLFLSISVCSGFGLIMEYLQDMLNTGRHFDYFDIIANIIGSLIGSLLNYFLRKK